MRVSKTVKDYIVKEVGKKYADKLKAIGADYNAKEKEINDMIDEKMNEFEKELKVLIAERSGIYEFKPSWDNPILSCRMVSDGEEKQRIRDQRREMEKEIEEKYTNIILELELGGTRADLERMLNEL